MRETPRPGVARRLRRAERERREDRLLKGEPEPRTSPIGVRSLVRMIDRGTARRGLCALQDYDGRVKLCDIGHRGVWGFGLVDIRRDSTRILLTIDDKTPLAVAMRNRVKPGELDPYDRWRRYVRQAKKAEAQAAANLNTVVQERYASAHRITVLPGIGVIPAGIAERRAWWQRRRKGGG